MFTFGATIADTFLAVFISQLAHQTLSFFFVAPIPRHSNRKFDYTSCQSENYEISP